MKNILLFILCLLVITACSQADVAMVENRIGSDVSVPLYSFGDARDSIALSSVEQYESWPDHVKSIYESHGLNAQLLLNPEEMTDEHILSWEKVMREIGELIDPDKFTETVHELKSIDPYSALPPSVQYNIRGDAVKMSKDGITIITGQSVDTSTLNPLFVEPDVSEHE